MKTYIGLDENNLYVKTIALAENLSIDDYICDGVFSAIEWSGQYCSPLVIGEPLVPIEDIDSYIHAIELSALNNLSSTDWKVIRHKDQIELGVPTSLTDDEYLTLLKQRQEWRNSIA